MKKKVIALIVILALVFSLSACSKKSDTSNEDTDNPTENVDNEDEGGSAAGTGFGPEYGPDDESTFVPDEAMQKEFAEFVDYQYKTSIESAYVNMHIYYMDPEAAGLNLDNVDIVIDEVPSPEKNAEDREYYQGLKKTLETFDRTKLTAEQRDEYDSLVWEINTVLQMLDEKFDYYSQYFAPPNSLDQNIASILTSFELRNEREVQELITLINSIPDFVDGAIEYAKVQQEKELLLTDFDTVISGCDDVLNIGTDSFLLRKLHERVDELEEISSDNKEKYKAQITEAIEKSYLPSIQAIKDAMNEMKGGYNNEEGLAAFPHGKEYFEIMMNYQMGLIDVPVEEMKSLLEERESKHMEALYEYISTNPEAMPIVMGLQDGQVETTGYTDYMEILEYLKSVMYQDHPEVKHLEYNVEPADAEEKLDEKNVAAYFLIPPLDGDHKQQMRINPSNQNVDSIDSYMTITHEGFPGHMYQYAYIYDNLYSDYLKTLGVNGNVEGYAVYAQYHAFDYLKDVNDATKVVSQLNAKMSYIMYSLVDIGINYEGWSRKETLDHLTDMGYQLTEDDVDGIYDYLRANPATYEPYAYGYELIEILREKAEEELGDKFNIREFNTALLNAGPTPYSVVQRHINTYIASAK